MPGWHIVMNQSFRLQAGCRTVRFRYSRCAFESDGFRPGYAAIRLHDLLSISGRFFLGELARELIFKMFPARRGNIHLH